MSEAEGAVDAQVEVAHGRVRVVAGAGPPGEPDIGRQTEALVDDVEQQRQARHGAAHRAQVVGVHLQFHLPTTKKTKTKENRMSASSLSHLSVTNPSSPRTIG